MARVRKTKFTAIRTGNERMKTSKVSVIVTTKNEAGHIGTCLESITQQTYPNVEIVVIDNHSADSTKQIARRFTPHIMDKGPERSAQRNYGAKQAKGEYLLFLDADMILTQNVVEESVRLMEKNNILKDLVIPEKSIGTGFWTQCKVLERSFYEGVDWIEAARFYRKDTFETLGGYDEHLTGPEDFDLPQRLKAKFGNEAVGRITSYILHNEGALSLRKTLVKKYYYGNKMTRYLAKEENRTLGVKQGSPFVRYKLYFSRPAVLFAHPVVGLGMLFMKTLEMGALAIGMMSNKL